MEDSANKVDSDLLFWKAHVEAYDKKAKGWVSKGRKIGKIYADSNSADRKSTAFNILWSNVQTLRPALYSGLPVPNVDRRFQDDEDINTTVAIVMERSLDYFVRQNDFDDCLKQATLDRLLSGRGTAWVRYMPHFQDVQIAGNEEIRAEGHQITEDINEGDEVETVEELYAEDALLDYVHWTDFGHSVARTWQEVRAVWRKVYLTKKEAKARFGEELATMLPYEYSSMGDTDEKGDADSIGDKALVIELWDRVTKKVWWFNPSMQELLDVKDDPLRLEGFFPCSKPIYSTLNNDSLFPTPDFIIYQDQAKELDTLTQRIEALNKALKVVGVYDATAEGVQRMLSENVDNKLIPVQQWAVFGEKGGLKGVVDFMPIDMVATVLAQLYTAREKCKQDIYELTGIADIIRGATNPKETATAQKIKGNFATLRLDEMKNEVERFSRDCVKLLSEIIAEHFSIETIKEISGVRLLTEAEKQQILMQQVLNPGPLDDNIKKLLTKPTWEQIEKVLRDNGIRCVVVNVQTDSTIKADQEAEKQARIEFLTAAGTFIREAAQIQSPELQPLLMEMLRFGIGGFKAGRELEDEFVAALNNMKQKLEQQKNQPPVDPLAEEKAKLASSEKIEMAKIQSNEKIEFAKAKAQMAGQMIKSPEEEEMEFEQSQTQAQVEVQKEAAEMQMRMQDMEMRNQQAQAVIAALQGISGQLNQLTNSVNKPIQLQRDVNGSLIGAV